MTKIEIIDDTVAYYSADVSRRSISDERSSKCLYKGPKEKECAFQRVVENDLSKYDQDSNFGFGSTCVTVMKNEPELKFKEGYEGHNAGFWIEIQDLHDRFEYWNNEGLTEKGKEYVESLKHKYSEN